MPESLAVNTEDPQHGIIEFLGINLKFEENTNCNTLLLSFYSPFLQSIPSSPMIHSESPNNYYFDSKQLPLLHLVFSDRTFLREQRVIVLI